MGRILRSGGFGRASGGGVNRHSPQNALNPQKSVDDRFCVFGAFCGGRLCRSRRCFAYGTSWLMNVPQFASSVRGAFGMNSAAIQTWPFSSATAAE